MPEAAEVNGKGRKCRLAVEYKGSGIIVLSSWDSVRSLTAVVMCFHQWPREHHGCSKAGGLELGQEGVGNLVRGSCSNSGTRR